MGAVYEYLWAVLVYWWLLVPGGVWTVDSALEYFWAGYRRQLDRFVSREVRRKLVTGTALAGVFFAGFLAWKDERDKVVEKQAEIGRQAERLATGPRKEIEQLTQANATLSDEVKRLQSQVTGMGLQRISEEDKVKMAEELKVAGSFPVEIDRLLDADSLLMADLMEVLKRAEWQVGRPIPKASDVPLVGLYLFVPPSDEFAKLASAPDVYTQVMNLVPAGAKALASVLMDHHIRFTVKPNQEQAPDTFSIFFGSRP